MLTCGSRYGLDSIRLKNDRILQKSFQFLRVHENFQHDITFYNALYILALRICLSRMNGDRVGGFILQRESEELRAALRQKEERRGASVRQSSPPWDGGGGGADKWKGAGGGRPEMDQPLYGIEPEPPRYIPPQFSLSGSVSHVPLSHLS